MQCMRSIYLKYYRAFNRFLHFSKVHKPKTTVEELQDENDILREENDELRSIVDHLRGYIRSIEAKHNAELEKSLSKGSDDASANVKPQCAFCNDPNCHLKKKCAKPPYQSNKVN